MSELRNTYRFYARMSSAVFVKVLLAGGGFWLGSKLDTKYHTSPYLMMLGFVVGAGVGLWWVIRTANRQDP